MYLQIQIVIRFKRYKRRLHTYLFKTIPIIFYTNQMYKYILQVPGYQGAFLPAGSTVGIPAISLGTGTIAGFPAINLGSGTVVFLIDLIPG